jgi:AraC family transcriptional regulator, transcriptional activator of pobA
MKEFFPHYSIGHFINQQTNPTEFEILRFEEMEEPDVDEVHKHTFYEILWTEKGKSKQTIDYQEYEVSPNSLFFISPNQVHRFEEWKPLTGGTILFTEDFLLLNQNNKDSVFELSFLDNFYANPLLQLDKAKFAEIKQTIDLITVEHHRENRSQSITQHLLHILLLQIQRLVNASNQNTLPKRQLVIFKQFKQLLEKEFAQNRSASHFAKALNITPHHLNFVCKTITQKTATEIIRTRCILEAKRYLTFTDKTVTEIADLLHFTDSSYFAKAFRIETHQSPLEFKKEISEKYRESNALS